VHYSEREDKNFLARLFSHRIWIWKESNLMQFALTPVKSTSSEDDSCLACQAASRIYSTPKFITVFITALHLSLR
jgi:hypothetical protein